MSLTLVQQGLLPVGPSLLPGHWNVGDLEISMALWTELPGYLLNQALGITAPDVTFHFSEMRVHGPSDRSL